ncbi:L-histidine N(alpha)-methyltransferase [Leucothrix pacifica]|uniref:L-histidine N(Alpha)-methyltransferase n=1 Tax=Leucothrix pacifica TaxID=1247513 RepID=A0A317CLQ3_9GAMM|nr:L-histidine N(alpha)-methyltransferase [Leucothrix pacifica]PWQ99515.1 L-histidine N(alpha)-methyltransferase [Leucothrix pacifica]
MNTQFAMDVDAGLSQPTKSLPSKYFYDQKGDELFRQIMALPEYYLTRAEHEIFTQQTQALIEALGVSKDKHFELIELGAGDGSKTKHLLKALLSQGYQFDYLPIDISGHVLELLSESILTELPALSLRGQQGDYFEILQDLKDRDSSKVVLFLGSNIGNMSDEQAAQFIYSLGANLSEGDKLLLGADLIKPVDIVLPAYNDAQGVTKAFNMNLLHRMNRELGANFVVDQFDHFPEYTEEEGIAKSAIISKVDQQVTIDSLNKTYSFAAGEKIHVEISRKYNHQVLASILKDTDFTIADTLTDSQGYFADFVLARH